MEQFASPTERYPIPNKTLNITNQLGGSFKYMAYEPISGTLYISDGTKLLTSVDNGTTRTLLATLPDGIRKVHLISSTVILVRIAAEDSTEDLYQSIDSGVTFTKVFDDVMYLDYGFLKATDGKLYIASYKNADGQIFCSEDSGATWTTVVTFPDTTGHIHFIQEDPYNPGILYAGTGDSADTQSRIFFTDDEWATYDLLGSGSQTWRAVSLVFTEDYIIWGMDSLTLTQPPYVVRLTRSNSAVEYLFQMSGPAYYSYKTTNGEILIGNCPENQPATTEQASQIYYSSDNGDTWQLIYNCIAPTKGYHILYFVGESTDGELYISQTQGLGLRYNLVVKIVSSASVATIPLQPATPLTLYYTADLNGQKLSNASTIEGRPSTLMHISANNESLYIGYLPNHNKTYLCYRGTSKLSIDSLGVQWSANGDGPIVKDVNGVRYKIYIDADGNITKASI